MKQGIVDQIMSLNIPGISEGIAELLAHYPEDIEALASGEVPHNLAYKLGDAGAAAVIQNIDKFSEFKLPTE